MNRRPCGSGERNGEQRRTKVYFGKTIMQALLSLKISEGVDDHPVSLLFITMIPIDCKILIFPYTCLNSIPDVYRKWATVTRIGITFVLRHVPFLSCDFVHH